MANIRPKEEITLYGVTCFYDVNAGEYFTYMNGNLVTATNTEALAKEINKLQTYVCCF